MADEIDPHVEETTGTVKKRFQQVIVIIAVIVTFGLIVGMYNAWTDDKAKAKAKTVKEEIKKAPNPSTAQEVGEGLADLDDFSEQVKQAEAKALREKRNKEKKAAIEEAKRRNKVRKEGLKAPESIETDESPETYDAYKKSVAEQLKPRKLDELIEVSSKNIRMQKIDEDFSLEERERALKARNLKFSKTSLSVKPPKGESNSGASSKREELERRREASRSRSRSDTSSRLATIRDKTLQAKALRERLTSGEFNADNIGELTSELRNLQASTPRQGTSRAKNPDGSERIVGATLDKAAEMQIEGVKLPTGYVIKAALGQTTISDYSNGTFKAQIGQDVYDADYETILFPKGTVIDGRMIKLANVNEPIQARSGMIVNYFVLPNGNRIDMRKSAAALDAMGIAGLKDEVNYHFLAQFLGVAAYAVVSSETATATSSQFTGETNIGGDINQSVRKQLQPLASRYLSLVPTITLNTGLPMTIYIEDEIILEPWGTIYDELL